VDDLNSLLEREGLNSGTRWIVVGQQIRLLYMLGVYRPILCVTRNLKSHMGGRLCTGRAKAKNQIARSAVPRLPVKFKIQNFKYFPQPKDSIETKMGKAKKTRKFAATKRILNANKDTRLQSVKSKSAEAAKKNPPKDAELVREMFPPSTPFIH